MSGTSRMRRESHVRICERLGVRFPGPTRQLVGDFKNAGRAWRPQGQPEELRVHDFLIKELGRAVPYGIYDLASSLIQLHVSNSGNVFRDTPFSTTCPPVAAGGGADGWRSFGRTSGTSAPAPHRLIGNDDAPLSQKEFNVPQAEAEHVIQPDGMADDLGGKAVAVVRVWRRLHAASLACLGPICLARLP